MRLFPFVALLPLAGIAAPDDNQFTPLFNGRDLSGWQFHGPVKKLQSWEAQNGVLRNDLTGGRGGTNLRTEREFWNFTLRFEYQVPEGSNSGVYLRGRHEIQLTGDYSARKVSAAGNGAIWNVKAPSAYASKPSGEWQSMEVTMVGNTVTAVLNGTTIHDKVVVDKATGGAINGNVNAPGPILLQGTHGPIKFRNIRIKELPK
jgi:hypothetical protein